MSTRLTALLSSAAMFAAASPAFAHDHEAAPALEPLAGVHDGEWQGEWTQDNTWRGMWNGTYTNRDGQSVQGQYIGTFVGEGRFITDDGHVLTLDEADGWHEGEQEVEVHVMRRPRDLGASPDGRLGYSMADREAWLSDCRLLMADSGGYYDHDRRDGGDGGLIGGLLGALFGGFAGNRIADGDRLAGTLIGGGLGGIAGAVIGSAVDGDGDEREIDANELWAARYCDAYLRRYEMGGYSGFADHGHGHHHGHAAHAAPAHGQRGHRHGRDCEVTVREEWVEVEVETPRPPARRAVPPRPQPAPQPAPQPEPGKTVPVS